MTGADELRSLLFLRLLPGVGDRGVARALNARGSATSVIELPEGGFRELLGPKANQARSSGGTWEEVDGVLERCRSGGVRVLGLGSPGYPRSLLALSDPPPVLFLRGDPGLLNRRAVAIVGSRRATATGRRAAERIAREISRAGVAVVSGLALGIDGAAHRGALDGRGGTVAVLGSGPDRAYPRANSRLFGAILEQGLIVSEFPPGTSARPYHFPRRNRVLAALSDGVVVVEAARKSGALITVDHALDLGLEIFAVPGSVERRQAEGANALLRDGAHVLTDGWELLEVMGWGGPADGSPGGSVDDGTRGSVGTAASPSAGGVRGDGDSDRERVTSVLERAPCPVDALVTELGIPAARILAALTRLEIDGVACREGGGWTRRSPR